MSRIEKCNVRRQRLNSLKDSSSPTSMEVFGSISPLEQKNIFTDALLEADRVKKEHMQESEIERKKRVLRQQKIAVGLKDYPKDSFVYKYIMPTLNCLWVIFYLPLVPISKLRDSTIELNILQTIVSGCLEAISYIFVM